MLLALAVAVAAAADPRGLEMPASQLPPVELSLTAPAAVVLPATGLVQIDIRAQEIPFKAPGDAVSGASPESNFTPGVFGGDVAPTPIYPAIRTSPAEVLLDPFVVRGDRYRRAQEAIDSFTVSDGRFNLRNGGRIARFTIGSLKLELGLWKHETVGPSFGPPIPVVNFLKFTW